MGLPFWSFGSGCVRYNQGNPFPCLNGKCQIKSELLQLTQDTTYYYVVTAINANGESNGSSEVAALPTGSLSAPGAVTAVPGVGSNKISWATVTGAISYNIYYTTGGTPPAPTTTNGTKIANVTSPYTHHNLTTGLSHNYIVTAVSASGESAASTWVSATPAVPVIVARLVTGMSQTILPNNVEVSVRDNDGSPMATATVALDGINLAYDSTRSIHKGFANVSPGATFTLTVTANGSNYALPTGVTQFASTSSPYITSPANGDEWPIWKSGAIDPAKVLDVLWSQGASLPTSYNYGVIVFDTVSINPYWESSYYWNNYILGTATQVPPNPPNLDPIPVNANLALSVYVNKTETIWLDGVAGGTSVGSIDIISIRPGGTITITTVP